MSSEPAITDDQRLETPDATHTPIAAPPEEHLNPAAAAAIPNMRCGIWFASLDNL
ncbi:MAG: hypothetical protein HC934_02035 [Acaryochloridaceae cyanobacterium SU_2_1]|nr:hypothetical protein [Acaryochloridaceae cyanobacterium SU_2_1]